MLAIRGGVWTLLAHTNTELGITHEVGPFMDLLVGERKQSLDVTCCQELGTYLAQSGSTSPYVREDEPTVRVPVSI